MSAIYRVSGYGPRVAHVLATINRAIQTVADGVARIAWLRAYERSERHYWPTIKGSGNK